MPTLAEYLKEKAARLKAEQPEREQRIREWGNSVERLLSQLEERLKAADHEGVLGVRRTQHHFNDEGMGSYTVQGLEVTTADGQAVSVVPVARRIVSAVTLPGEASARQPEGRVDLQKWGDTIYTLYRFRKDDQDRWFVAHPVWNMNEQRPVVNPLTREEFEQDIMSMLE